MPRYAKPSPNSSHTTRRESPTNGPSSALGMSFAAGGLLRGVDDGNEDLVRQT
jgi:hypothetical protein